MTLTLFFLLSIEAEVLTLSNMSHHLYSAAKAGSSSSSSSPGPSSSPAKASEGSSLSSQLCDPQHKDCLFREFRKLCALVAENNSYNVKTQIIEKFLKKGSGGGWCIYPFFKFTLCLWAFFCGRRGFLLLKVCLKSSFPSSQISSTEIFT